MKRLALVAGTALLAAGCRSASEPRRGVWGPLIVPEHTFAGPFAFHGVTFFFETTSLPQLERRGDDEILACGTFAVGFRFQLYWFDGRKHYLSSGSHVYFFVPRSDPVTVQFQGRAHQLPFKGQGTPYAVVDPKGTLTWYGKPIVEPAGGGR
ncbi:MAG: hypothetical protein JXP34_14980 [Planctomycetes bacterium]|nr:hypothetical protein [Planctomycetota bacterium]